MNRRKFLQAGMMSAAIGSMPELSQHMEGMGLKGPIPSSRQGEGSRGITDTSMSPHVKCRSVDMNSVHWTDGFWSERFDLCRRVIIPSMWSVLQIPNNAASYRNFLKAAGLEKGRSETAFFGDGDFYKWLESVAHMYAATRDEQLNKQADEVIAVISKAQESDGYISTPIQLNGLPRWSNIQHHELYNMGHLMTCACIHYRATGKTSLLDVATKSANYLYGVFQPRPPHLAHFGFDPSQIMGLVEMYRTTRDRRYLELAGIFVTNRGSQPRGTDWNQDHVPLRSETRAVGHAVCGPYLYCGAADVYAETGERALWEALDRIREDAVQRKMYVTGGIGSIHRGISERGDYVAEAFGRDYQLPNRTAYSESCANIANAMWNWRMLAATGDAKYTDIMERVFYNSMLSGKSLSGEATFYTNVLSRDGADQPLLSQSTLERWVKTAPNSPIKGVGRAYCCPTNFVRTMASLHEYVYGLSDARLWVHLFGGNTLEAEWPDGSALRVTQETQYPWDGKIRLRVEKSGINEFAIMLRIPGWCENASLSINGETATGTPTPGSYFEVRRRWSEGNTVDIEFPMPVQFIKANPLVESDRNQVAVMRGPLVYCLESPDLSAAIQVSDVAVSAQTKFTARFDKSILGGVTVLEGEALILPGPSKTESLYGIQSTSGMKKVAVRLIPYYAWANRGISHMAVWLPFVA